MRDVISSYSGQPKRSFMKIAIIVIAIVILSMIVVLILYRPWIDDVFKSENNNLVMSFTNVGNVRDKDFSVEVNSTPGTYCDFKTSVINVTHICVRMPQTKSQILLKCNFVVPGQKINVSCLLSSGVTVFNMTMKSRYQYIKRNYVCQGTQCRYDESLLTGPLPAFISYLTFYWGDRLFDFTEWANEGGDPVGKILQYLGLRG